jgi:hypothetical protein
VLYLASDEAKHVTGVMLPVDSGMSLQPPGIPPIAATRLAELESSITASYHTVGPSYWPGNNTTTPTSRGLHRRHRLFLGISDVTLRHWLKEERTAAATARRAVGGAVVSSLSALIRPDAPPEVRGFPRGSKGYDDAGTADRSPRSTGARV